MTPSYSKPVVGGNSKKTSSRHIAPVIMLACVKKPEQVKVEYNVIKYPTNPSDPSLPTHDLLSPYFKHRYSKGIPKLDCQL